MKTYIFHVNGMHCQACITLIEGELLELPEMRNAKADLDRMSVEVEGNFGDKSAEHVATDLSEILKPHGYTLSLEKQKYSAGWRDFRLAFPIALGFVFLFLLLQKIGIVNLVTTSEVSLGTAFLIGIIASLSTCMAVVGGLVLSMSANFAKEGDKIKPQAMFHISRLISFFVLGGLIGVLGSAFQLGGFGTFIVSLIVGVVMLTLGLNLLDVFPAFKKFQPTMPRFIGSRVHRLKNMNHVFTPCFLGAATFFLPCGFTQSMQIYTLATGGFIAGALLMSSFALGTLPVLAGISFSSLSIHSKAQSGVFFKAVGLIVIFFAIFAILNSLAAVGFIQPIFNF